MIEWLSRFFLYIASAIASLFVARDALNFNIIAMVVAVLLVTLLVMIIAFWSVLVNWFKHFSTKKTTKN